MMENDIIKPRQPKLSQSCLVLDNLECSIGYCAEYPKENALLRLVHIPFCGWMLV